MLSVHQWDVSSFLSSGEYITMCRKKKKARRGREEGERRKRRRRRRK
jgi:hypothetical protein